MVSTKFSMDRPLNNQIWSLIAGMQLQEINRLESHFLRGMDFNLVLSPTKFSEYEFLLYTYANKTGILEQLTQMN